MHWWRRKQREQDLERELRSHLELEAEERRETGLVAGTCDEASRPACCSLAGASACSCP